MLLVNGNIVSCNSCGTNNRPPAYSLMRIPRCAGYVRGKAEDAVIKIVEVQNAIEAIDRAIKDEEAASGFDAKAQIG